MVYVFCISVSCFAENFKWVLRISPVLVTVWYAKLFMKLYCFVRVNIDVYAFPPSNPVAVVFCFVHEVVNVDCHAHSTCFVCGHQDATDVDCNIWMSGPWSKRVPLSGVRLQSILQLCLRDRNLVPANSPRSPGMSNDSPTYAFNRVGSKS